MVFRYLVNTNNILITVKIENYAVGAFGVRIFRVYTISKIGKY